MKHAVTKIRKRRKQEIVNAFGGKCSICGYDKCLNALQFHHTDPKLKTVTPTKVINEWNTEKAFETLKNEKCILVCANCHSELHSEDYDYSKLRDDVKNVIQKKCELCEKKFYYYAKSKKEQKFCSDECAKLSLRKVERPTYSELKQLLETHSYVRIGKMFGVSDNAVRKWLKKYEADVAQRQSN